jgi:hypothetical protein
MAALFKRLFNSEQENAAAGWPAARRWAEGAGHRFAVGRGGEGFVVESQGAGPAVRIEWGPSQRQYIAGQELRVRADIGPATDLQMLVATRALMERLERDVFEQYTEGTETRIDDHTPEEMRWLVLYPQVSGKVLGALHERFGLLSNRPRASTLWLEEGLAGPLAKCITWHDPTVPMVLVVQRGRFVLRLALAEPRIAVLDGAVSLGLAAAAAARRVAEEVSRGAVNSAGPSTWGVAPAARAEDSED